MTTITAPDHTESFVYDDKKVLTSKTVDGTTYAFTHKATADQSLDSITVDGKSVRPNTDALGRNTGKVIEVGDNKITEEKISYIKFGDHATNLPSTVRFASNGVFKESMQYRYDSMGNIIEVFENGRSACRYEYDALGRLTREDNVAFGKTTTWAYDNNGNIIARYEYAITTKPTSELYLLACKIFTYCYAENSDQLLSITIDDDKTITTETFEYDAIGNPEKYRGIDATWQYGRQLATYKDSTYTYDARGRRTKKEVAVRDEEGNLTEEVIETSYTYDSNGNLIKQSNGLEFLYDHTGVFAVKYDDETYFYRKDAQSNIVELLDSNGAAVVKYKYDAWGNCQTTVVDSSATTIAELNPFRYRSYYFDTEANLYFLKTRYYDPEIGRFMTIDDISYLDPESINGLNLYSYCGNNPVNNSDSTGTFAISTFLIGLAVSFFVTWAAGEIFGHQLVGGIGSAAGGVSAIATGISLFAFGPVGWVIGGIAIIAGAASIAFGTAEIQEHFTGNNWIQDSFGWSDGLYNGLYFAFNIVASLASVGGQIYKNLTTTTKLFRAVNSAEANSIAKTRMFSEGAGQMEGKFFATQKAHALQWGEKLGSNRIVSIRVPKSALSNPSVTYFHRLDSIGPAYYFSDLDFLNSIFRNLRLH